MQTKTIMIVIAIVLAIGSAIYFSQMDYKYSCNLDSQCYPCTRWMNCVSEGFYLKNTNRCRIGAEENYSRVVCRCEEQACKTVEIKPMSAKKVDAWVPGDN